KARADGVPPAWIDAARRSPVYKMAMEWKVAFPLHPEYRTLPMVWYVPPLSPVQAAFERQAGSREDLMPDVTTLRIPLRYLANLLTGGKTEPVALALKRMLAMRRFMRRKNIEGAEDDAVLAEAGMDRAMVEDMYKVMAIANYEDRFVIPTTHREAAEDAYELRGGCGFSFGDGCAAGGITGGARSAESRRPRTPLFNLPQARPQRGRGDT
ncbi:MAG TPA: nitrate reductase subunit beta, partial [bacterium]|nr:nitrate reductase subunit beta [bacterium]